MNTKSNILIGGGLILIGLVSFISGRLSAPTTRNEKEIDNRKGISMTEENPKILETPINVLSASTTKGIMEGKNEAGNSTSTSETYLFIASKAGKKYFPVTCGSAKTIKKENAIYFKSEEEAQNSGRTKSLQCK